MNLFSLLSSVKPATENTADGLTFAFRFACSPRVTSFEKFFLENCYKRRAISGKRCSGPTVAKGKDL